MRNHSFLFALIGAVMLAFTACEKELKLYNGDFPKKNLIEEFTGQDCGYCPSGMDYIHDFIKNDTNWVVVLHHDGYTEDNFTVKGSSEIASKLEVEGAPSMSINREETSYTNEKGKEVNEVVFHPGYLGYVTKSFAKTTYASVNIANTYDANSRKLHVKVTGQIGKADYPALKLTVLVKESGMIDYQSDYNNTFKGWKEFRHTNAVRAFLTETFGSPISVVDKNRSYTAEYDIELSDKWNAENCMVVAFLTEGEYKPAIQANQRPVVSGSKGGADIQHGGITKEPVPDYYPEPSATAGPKDYTNQEKEIMSNTQASYKSYSSDGFKFWTIMAYNPNITFKFDGTTCIPAAFIYVFTDLNATSIPNGTYPFSLEPKPGNAYAGFRDDEHYETGGSNYSPVSRAYFQQGYLVPTGQWLIASGTLTVTDEGWSVTGKARNGADINIVGTAPIAYRSASNNAPA
ncbi:MAG: Omp28-related outer membrane protein, partial [Paludibacteraceae bacterium]|nr:Omp28-related outer membrane protein [Paludibacteraceae bacterium]